LKLSYYLKGQIIMSGVLTDLQKLRGSNPYEWQHTWYRGCWKYTITRNQLFINHFTLGKSFCL